MELSIAGKRALVLGASGGLGAAVVKSLLAEGVVVYGAARNVAKIEALRSELPTDAASRLHAVAVDLSKLESVDQLAQHVLGEGPVDILVNNSGGPPPGPAATAASAAWAEHFSAMAISLFTLTQHVLPGMRERQWGRILTIASSGVEQPIPNLALSNGIRASVLGWSKTLAAEVAAQGVTVNVVLPGRIHTDRVDALDQAAATRQGKTVSDIAAASVATIPAGRYGKPQEFADVVTFLASERASYITGAKIRVDGGMIRSI